MTSALSEKGGFEHSWRGQGSALLLEDEDEDEDEDEEV